MKHEMKLRIESGWDFSLAVARYPAILFRLAVAAAVMAALWLFWFFLDTGVYMYRLWGKLREWAALARLWASFSWAYLRMSARRAVPYILGMTWTVAAEVARLGEFFSGLLVALAAHWAMAWSWREELVRSC